MRGRLIWAQLAIFATISVVITAYTVFGVLGVHAGPGPYHVTLHLRNGGGIFDGAEVSLRGVQIGRVTSVRLTTDEVVVRLAIEHGRRVRANSIAHVYDLSAVGEQYVDFEPQSDAGPWLRDGDDIPATRTSTPVRVPTVLFDLEQLVGSVNTADVRTLTTELANAFRDTGPQLRDILVDGAQLVDQLTASQRAALDLLHNSRIALTTAAKHGSDFASFTASLRALSETLAQRDPQLNGLLAESATATTLVDELVTQNASAATALLANLATVSGIQVARVPALRALLVAVPRFGQLVPTIVRNGALQIVIYVNGTQQVCQYGPALTSPLSGTRSAVQPVDCRDLKPGELVRGAANAPRPSAHVTANGVQVAQFDAATGTATAADASSVQLGWNGGQQALLGDKSWQALLLSGTGS